jgi:hypothetical protein
MKRKRLGTVVGLLLAFLIPIIWVAFNPSALEATLRGFIISLVGLTGPAIFAIRLFLAEKARGKAQGIYTTNYDGLFRVTLAASESAASARPISRREALAGELVSGARIDEIKAMLALTLIPTIVLVGAAVTNHFDGGPAPGDAYVLAYALVKRLGFLGVTFYLAHAAVSQYRYSTLRAAHYRACAQALIVCDDDASLVQVYRMLLPPHAFGTAPASPVDTMIKIAAGKSSKD